MYRTLLFVLLVFVGTSCYYDNAEDLYQNYPPQECDVSAVSYSLDVAPIIDLNCLQCHQGTSPIGGIDLSTYQAVSFNALEIRNRINLPQGSALVMPQSGPMAKCNIDKINAWIDQGALNN